MARRARSDERARTSLLAFPARGFAVAKPPRVENQDTIGLAGDGRVVGHHDHGRLAFSRRPEDQIDDVDGRLRVEASCRLVGENDSGLIDKGPGDGDALALATRQLVGKLPALVVNPTCCSAA